MKFFMLEWWNEQQMKYNQEYFVSFKRASERFTMLDTSVPSANVEITTLHTEDTQ